MLFVTQNRFAIAMLACCVSWQLASSDRMDDWEEVEAEVVDDFDELVERQEDPKIKEPLEELQRMVGLSSVKASMERFMARMTVDKGRRENGLKETGANCMHMKFLGNPGTGKTVVARIVGKLMVAMNLIKPKVVGTEESNVKKIQELYAKEDAKRKGEKPSEEEVIFKEVSRSDLVAQYKGQTAPKVREAIKSAFGGVLFIDEAYSLAKKSDPFGKEAIDTLIKEMEDNREHVVVILAGYDREMDDLFNSNPGFLSRVPHAFHFDDYSCNQLVTIGEAFLNSKNMHLGFVTSEVPKEKDPLDFVCKTHPDLEGCWWLREIAKYSTNCCEDINDRSCRTSRDNGNGRTIRNLLEAALRRTASRVMLENSVEELENFDSEELESQPINCEHDSTDLRCHFLQLKGTDLAKVASFYMAQSHNDLCGDDNLDIDSDDLMNLEPQQIIKTMGLFRGLKWEEATCADVASVANVFQKTSLVELTFTSNSSYALLEPPTPCEMCLFVAEHWLPIKEKPDGDKKRWWKGLSDSCDDDKQCKATVEKLKFQGPMLGDTWRIGNAAERKQTCKVMGMAQCKKKSLEELPIQPPQGRPSVIRQGRKPSVINKQARPSVIKPYVPNRNNYVRPKLYNPHNHGRIKVGDFKQTKREQQQMIKQKSGTLKQTKADELMDKLENDYVGLQPVKRAMRELKSTIEFSNWRKKWFGPKSSLMGQSFHMQFLGNPGTGKTVVARQIGKILFHLGVITPPPPTNPSEDSDKEALKREFKFKEVARADLVGQHVGATAKLVKQKVESALGGVLFIDEAYSLVKGGKGGGSDQFGKEAVDELIKEMENNRAHVIVVLAGYRNEMKSFIESNPGFKSRVPLSFNFDDYTCGELMEIGKNQLDAKEIKMAQGTKEALEQAFRISTGCCEALGSNCVSVRENGNGRTVRNVLEGAYRFMAGRILVDHTAAVAKLQQVGKQASAAYETAKTAYCTTLKFSSPSRSCMKRVTPRFLVEQKTLDAPCLANAQLCNVLSSLEPSDVMKVLQETVYLNLHRLCSPGEGEAPEFNLGDLKILVRVLPELSEQDLKSVLRTDDCFEGTSLLKRAVASLQQDQKDTLYVDPPALDFTKNCRKECCEVQEVFKDIEKLIGLDTVKLTMRELYSLVEYSQLRNKLFLPPTSEQSFHMKFVGNPGTGKTVVARLVGELLLEMGAVSKKGSAARVSNRCKPKTQNLAVQQREIKQLEKKGQAKEDITFVEASRADLVAPYLGQTAPKVMEAVEKALGGVFFIDEAYSLVREDGDDSFGLEAVDTLIKEMEDKRAQVVVILAGYEKEMESFFKSNPGFKSRVPFTFHFDDYKCSDLVKIGNLQLGEQDFQLVASEGEKFKGLIRFASGCCEDNNCRTNRENGNGRTVRNVVDSLATQQMFRLSKVDPSKLTVNDYKNIHLNDLKQAAAWLVADLLGRACSRAGQIALVTDALKVGQVTLYLDGGSTKLKPITTTIDRVMLARSALQGLISTSDAVFGACEQRIDAIKSAFVTAVERFCGATGRLGNYSKMIESTGTFDEDLMREIKDDTEEAQALTLSLEHLKHIGVGEKIGENFADGSLVKTCKSSMRKLVDEEFQNVDVGALLAWGQQ